MSRDRILRAVVCHLVIGSGVSIAIAACGGAIASTDATPDGGSSSPTASASAPQRDGQGGGQPPPPFDAGPAPKCIDVEPTDFDTSCTVDTDCITMTAGKFCDGQSWCMCGIATINAADKASYDAVMSKVTSELHPGEGRCFCPFFGVPHCVAGACRICGGAAGECPDGG